MKTQIYIENGKVQIVLTPENDFEKYVVAKISDERLIKDVGIFNGTFSECKGGYIRHYEHENNDGLILYLKTEVSK